MRLPDDDGSGCALPQYTLPFYSILFAHFGRSSVVRGPLLILSARPSSEHEGPQGARAVRFVLRPRHPLPPLRRATERQGREDRAADPGFALQVRARRHRDPRQLRTRAGAIIRVREADGTRTGSQQRRELALQAPPELGQCYVAACQQQRPQVSVWGGGGGEREREREKERDRERERRERAIPIGALRPLRP